MKNDMSRMRDLKTGRDEKNRFGLIQAEAVSCRAVPLQDPVAEIVKAIEKEARWFLCELVAGLIRPAHGTVSLCAAKRPGVGGGKKPDGRIHA